MSVVRRFTDAFNRADVDALVQCFTDGATYRDTFYGQHVKHAGLRAMFERMFREGTEYAWSIERLVESPAMAAAEWTFSYIVSDAVPRSAGRKIRFPGMSLFELENGKIAAYREYFDTGAALIQLGFAPEALDKVLRRRLSEPR